MLRLMVPVVQMRGARSIDVIASTMCSRCREPVATRFETQRLRNRASRNEPGGFPAVRRASGFGTIHRANFLRAQRTGNSRRCEKSSLTPLPGRSPARRPGKRAPRPVGIVHLAVTPRKFELAGRSFRFRFSSIVGLIGVAKGGPRCLRATKSPDKRCAVRRCSIGGIWLDADETS